MLYPLGIELAMSDVAATGDGDAERYVGGAKKQRAARQGASKVANLRLARVRGPCWLVECVPVPQGFQQDADANSGK